MMNTFLEGGASFFDCFLAIYFITKYNYSTWKKNVYYVPAILITFIFQLYADAHLGDFSVITSSIQFVLALIYATLIAKKHYIRAFISVCIFKVTLITLSSALYNFFGILFKDFENLLLWGDGISRYVYVITHKVLLLAISQLILHLINRESVNNISNGLLTFFFSMITVAGLSITISITEQTTERYIHTQLLLIALIFLSLNILLYILLSQLSHLQKKNFDLKLQNEVVSFESGKYQEALNVWHNAEKIRHDVKHHMIAISAMLEVGDINGCKTYLEKYLCKIQSNGKFSKSGNTVIDYLIDSKLSPLDNTEIIVSGSVTNLTDIDDADLASLIGNILDNAIEAETKIKEKRIELHFISQYDNRIIVCKNNIESSVLKENQNLHTTKGTHHGYGCQIIAEIVKKYSGLVNYFEEGNMFGVQIILPVSNKSPIKKFNAEKI